MLHIDVLQCTGTELARIIISATEKGGSLKALVDHRMRNIPTDRDLCVLPKICECVQSGEKVCRFSTGVDI